MKITSLNTHDDHEVRIHLCRGIGPHYSALRCVSCNKHIQWLGQEATNLLARHGVDIWKHYNTEGLNSKHYHDFPAHSRYKTETKDFWE